jgi:membrane fusion protein (multidrug efflux system)
MEPTPVKANNRGHAKKLRLFLALLVVAALLLTAYWLVFLRHRVTTDNAYVMANSARLSSRVSGAVSRVLVENDQPVGVGQLLVELDPRDYQAVVDQTRGALNKIEAEISAAAISIDPTDIQTAAQIEAAEASRQEAIEKVQEHLHGVKELEKERLVLEAELRKTKRDFERFDSLSKSGAVSEESRDKTYTALVKAEAQLEAIEAELAAERASLGAAKQEVERTQAQLKVVQSDRYQVDMQRYRLDALKAGRQAAQAALEAAQLNLSYCQIKAPIAGYVAQKNVQIGDWIQPGQPLMAVVPLQDVYVEANFKEVHLKHVRIGQPATIKADVYPDYTYHGRVVGIRAGTGASFSLLPPENATGNWIKVVQRVPVKIEFDEPPPPDHPLRLGLSLHVSISTKDRSGDMLVAPAPKP